MHADKKVEKVLSINDLGRNGAHQGGMLIPKKKEILDFFPLLDSSAENPRKIITFYDDLQGKWKFNYIYYNNKLRGGTRNEYRLTGMTAFFRAASLEPDDTVIFTRTEYGYKIGYRRKADDYYEEKDDVVRISLGNSWTIIDL